MDKLTLQSKAMQRGCSLCWKAWKQLQITGHNKGQGDDRHVCLQIQKGHLPTPTWNDFMHTPDAIPHPGDPPTGRKTALQSSRSYSALFLTLTLSLLWIFPSDFGICIFGYLSLWFWEQFKIFISDKILNALRLENAVYPGMDIFECFKYCTCYECFT